MAAIGRRSVDPGWHIMPARSNSTLPNARRAVPTRNVVLTPHHEQIVERLVSSSRYQNASEVMREGLRILELREAEDAARLQALRDAARTGSGDIEEGRFTDVSDDELDEYIDRLGREASARAQKSRI